MKKTLFAFLLLCSLESFAQEARSLQISAAYGFPESTYYYYGAKPSKTFNYNLDFDYFITPKHIFSVNYMFFEKRYFNDYSAQLVSIGAKPLTPYENSEVINNFFSLLYKYKALEYRKLNLVVGIGLGISIQNIQEVYFQHTAAYAGAVNTKYDYGMGFSTPIRVELNYAFHKYFSVGALAGTIISVPDFSITITRFVQPKISFHF